MASRLWKSPCENGCPGASGIWSSTITSPIPALKPISTGSEMKLATNPNRRTWKPARGCPRPRSVRVAEALTGTPDRPPGPPGREARPGQNGDRCGGAHAERPGGPERCVDQHRQEHRVEPHLDRQPGNGGIGHRLRDDHRGRRQTGHHVRAAASPSGIPATTQSGNENRLSFSLIHRIHFILSSSIHRDLTLVLPVRRRAAYGLVGDLPFLSCPDCARP